MFEAFTTDWYEEYISKPVTEDEIKKEVKKLQKRFIRYFVLSIALIFIGIFGIGGGGNNVERISSLMVFIAGAGSCNVVKIWSHIQLSKWKILWVINNTFKDNTAEELRKIQASDL